MAEYIVKYKANNQRSITVKFHAPVVNFRRVELFKYMGSYYKIYVDKNNSVYHLEKTKVISWKEIMKGKRKIHVPDVCESTPEPQLLNKIKGNPYDIAVSKIMTEIERAQL